MESPPDRPDRDSRIARNQHAFRMANQNIAASVVPGKEHPSHLYEFVCECARLGCSDLIPMTLGEYEAVRARGERFALVAGHEFTEVESVVERHGSYWVVEKQGAGGATAQELSDRGSERA